ncbi:NAD(P)/FAD-dependent oxidoreductase [Brevundimonas intermedia]|uniref:NAD(P)/FAD-dependent oxidoreductase n=1 Tax=Brevundimonas intermedia TaxID=74315 RepID=A0A4Y9RZJ5_9CAUL|nr:NAD(P)/FAD-dependent oxidoreductase [Brevundimonas intermedia]TFW14570.1 NAD(P)/FAD-dependent oxidoreductase [Brevundimonas intermedia]
MTRASVDVLVVGAGAAGMMAAIEAGRRGRRVLVVDHADRPGEKIRISGGGRCNFTNLGCGPANFLGENPRFATSALRRYTQHDFVKRIDKAGIAWHEKTLGQLFCDDSAKQIVRMLTDDMASAGAALNMKTGVERIARSGDGWSATLSDGSLVAAASLVVATGGKSIPKMGATGWAYDVARQFDIRVTETRPALVPLTFEAGLLETLVPLAGVAVDASVASAPEGAKARKASFKEAMLFTHRGLSGPAILQISSYWREGEAVVASMAPGRDVFEELKAAKATNGRQAVHTALGHIVPRRLAESLCVREGASGNLADLSDKVLRRLDQAVNAWGVKPVGSEGYRTAEVTLGGIDTAALDQQTMQAKAVPGLYFVGEAVDVTGWLGGYNFQWAWSSGWAAGQVC